MCFAMCKGVYCAPVLYLTVISIHHPPLQRNGYDAQPKGRGLILAVVVVFSIEAKMLEVRCTVHYQYTFRFQSSPLRKAS